MEWATFQKKVNGVLPREELPPRRYWIGVLLPHKSHEHHECVQEDFLWIKAHSKITVGKVNETYKAKYPDHIVELRFQDSLPSPTTTVGELNSFADNVVVFKATDTRTRAPLQPINRQLPAESQLSQLRANDEAVKPIKSETELGAENAVATLAATLAVPPASTMPSIPLSNQRNTWDRNYWDRPTLMPTPAMPSSLETAIATNDIVENQPMNERSGSTAQSESTSALTVAHGDIHPVKAEEYSHSSRSPTPPAQFNPDEFFDRDPSPTAETEAKPSDEFIRQLIDLQDPDLLEAGVAKALSILESLKMSFLRYPDSADAQAWAGSIDKLKTQAERKRTVVGVVGNTGAGKSSVINAMLDEERLVPTNCMRACTAVVTELSWNDSTVPSSKYRAQIEFISRDDWEKELNTLLKEILSENGTVSREMYDQNSEAGIAWAKFHAVYPQKTKDSLSDCSVAGLMAERSVTNVLGTTKNIQQATPQPFYRELQNYVDSKEKATMKGKTKEKNKNASQMEYWPLIKVVKIQTKSPALSTGAVIVDLPGVHDSNAARAAVAGGYMKQCTGLWIVAPINRAVDDKAAKTLLGDSFKRQLKYDGGFSTVTFICSKTDDISITEATESLDLEDQIGELDAQEQEHKKTKQALKDKIEELRESQEVYKQVMDTVDEDVEVWEKLLDDLNEGETVFAPQKKGGKRKRAHSSGRARKKHRDTMDDSDDDFIISDADTDNNNDSGSESDMDGIEAPQEPLTEDEIKAKLEDFKATKKNARRERGDIEKAIKDIRPQIRDATEKAAEIRAEMNAICIAGRNDYSKGAIQLDFAAGIKELDQENAADEDEENFNPDEDLRDYDEVARSLPVFCVSSRAYQKMCGRLQKDDNVPGFESLEETEIPQLQAHCKKLTEAGRIQTCKSFLLNLCQQLATFSFWASDDGTGLQLAPEERTRQVSYLEKRLKELENGLDKAVETCIDTAKKVMSDQIFDKYPELIEEAVRAAPDIARGWGGHRDSGGLFWATYKAIVRRDGAYTSSSAGYRDFNAELVDPITKRLATGWERAFQNRLPKAFEVYTRDSGKILHRFHEMVEERARQNGVGLANLALLRTQIYTYEQLFADLLGVLVSAMTELQRDANRDFTPTIVAIMHTVYQICADERGTGSFMRMKHSMSQHVEQSRHHMFLAATQSVKGHLNDMCKQLKNKMEEKADEIFVSMRRDYMSVLGGIQVSQNAAMSKDERNMRSEIRTRLMKINDQFRGLAGGELEDVTEMERSVRLGSTEASAETSSMLAEVKIADQEHAGDMASSYASSLTPVPESLISSNASEVAGNSLLHDNDRVETDNEDMEL